MQCSWYMERNETDQIYERAGWGNRVPRGSRPAVLVVDLSRGFTESRFPTGADLTEVVSATWKLLESARAAGARFFSTTIAYEQSDLEGGCAWLRRARGRGIRGGGTELVALAPRLPRRDA